MRTKILRVSWGHDKRKHTHTHGEHRKQLASAELACLSSSHIQKSGVTHHRLPCIRLCPHSSHHPLSQHIDRSCGSCNRFRFHKVGIKGSKMRAAGSLLLQRRALVASRASTRQDVLLAANRAIGNNDVRFMSSYVLDGLLGRRGQSSAWPITKPNTIFNIVPQGHRYVRFQW